MTERKPREISFTSWIDRQINEAQERGEFDNLPGAGKPLPRGALSGDAWLRNYLDREGVSAEAMESDRIHARAAIMRAAVNREDAPGAEGGWLDWLRK